MNIKKEGTYLVIDLEGEIDEHTCKQIKTSVDLEYDKTNTKNIVFNLKNISFLDSSGVGMILGRFKKVNDRGGQVYVTNVNEQVDRIFSMSGMYRVIEKSSLETLIGKK